MALISASNSPNIRSFHSKPISKNPNLCPFSLSFPLCKARLCAINTGSDEGGSVGNSRQAASYGADLLRKPVVASPPANDDDGSAKESSEDDESGKKSGDGDTWVDWEDQILEDTVPLVGFVRMILHSGKYESGDRLSPEHERMILERLLPYHPESEKKIGCGVDYITIGYHPNFESSRCLFIVRKDGELVDFSYWKCIKGLIRKNYPLYADSFILRHFRRRRRSY
ncbi:protein DCL, chloroplastic isoform X1 [Sesamum indicum]|uniref:Protein DCL, chloroplastic isoform X1 n=1 Tax=Sesamum indicum TaxID=4182 RepID=A0A6I9SXW9_SESIN|nr:protein DCL, chloroplastic isoform X1 [Sesamum indicum]